MTTKYTSVSIPSFTWYFFFIVCCVIRLLGSGKIEVNKVQHLCSRTLVATNVY